MPVKLIALKEYKRLQKSTSHARTVDFVRIPVPLEQSLLASITCLKELPQRELRLVATADSEVDIDVGELMCSKYVCSSFSYFCSIPGKSWLGLLV